MKKCLLIFLILFISLFSIEVYADQSKEKIIEIESFKGNKICPVFFNEQETEEQFSYDYEGKKVYFCCAKCIEYFQNNPKYFMKKLEKKENKEKEIIKEKK